MQNKIGAPLVIEGFPIIPCAQLEAPWFETSQHQKQNKQSR
jgi:hypothetical protein